MVSWLLVICAEMRRCMALCLQAGSMHIIPAVRTGHCITATFQLPSLRGQYRRKPEDYLSHLVGHEGRGSLLSGLKARGWATQLSAGVGDGGFERSSATYLFDVSVTLTEAGLQAGPGEWVVAGCGRGIVGGLSLRLCRWSLLAVKAHRCLCC